MLAGLYGWFLFVHGTRFVILLALVAFCPISALGFKLLQVCHLVSTSVFRFLLDLHYYCFVRFINFLCMEVISFLLSLKCLKMVARMPNVAWDVLPEVLVPWPISLVPVVPIYILVPCGCGL